VKACASAPSAVPREACPNRNSPSATSNLWLPELSPSAKLVAVAQKSKTDAAGKTFQRKFRSEMNRHEAARLLDLLAAFSHQTNFSLGCYCENEQHCHRSVLKQLLAARGAAFS
jgi:uncharacterized protein YeaO (DUF488 family)